jgi:hypothetical protein
MSRRSRAVWRHLASRFMDLKTAITAIVAFAAGVAADWIKQWSSSWFSNNNEVRRAIQAEIKPLIISMSFYIMAVTEDGNDENATAPRYFGDYPHLESFLFYWEQKRDRILKLAEWSRLKNFHESLVVIGRDGRPPLFTVIMLLESLTIEPFGRCVDRESLKFARRILDRPEVQKRKMEFLMGR